MINEDFKQYCLAYFRDRGERYRAVKTGLENPDSSFLGNLKEVLLGDSSLSEEDIDWISCNIEDIQETLGSIESIRTLTKRLYQVQNLQNLQKKVSDA